MSKTEVNQAYQGYLDASLAHDLAAIDALVRQSARLHRRREGQHARRVPDRAVCSDCLRSSGTPASTWDYEVVNIGDTDAHLILKRGVRVRPGTAVRSSTSRRSMPGPGPRTDGRYLPSRTSRCRAERPAGGTAERLRKPGMPSSIAAAPPPSHARSAAATPRHASLRAECPRSSLPVPGELQRSEAT